MRLGGVSRSALRGVLREHGVQLNRAAEELFDDGRFVTLDRESVVEVEARSVGALGFAAGAKYTAIIARARESGLRECALEVGPQLRWQWMQQEDGTDGEELTHGRAPPGSITVASVWSDERDTTARGFYLRCVAGVPWLRGYYASVDHVWSAEDVLLFQRTEVG